MKDIVVTLYHANWCGHCKTFKPEWEMFDSACNKFKDDIEKKYGVSLSCKEFEDSKDSGAIEKAGVRGFPTIHIAYDNKVQPYEGERSMKGLLMTVLDYDNKNKKKQEEIDEDIAQWKQIADENSPRARIVDESREPRIHDSVVGMLERLGLQQKQQDDMDIDVDITQFGGKSQVDSYAYYKYLKYKQKYMELRKQNKNKKR